MNWEEISSEPELTEDFIRDHKEKVNWEHISKYQRLSNAFILEMEEHIHFDDLSYNENLTEENIQEFSSKLYCDYIIVRHFPVSDQTLQDMFPYINWKNIHNLLAIYNTQFLPFVQRYQEHIHWTAIFENYSFSEEEMKILGDTVQWNEHIWSFIVITQHLSEEFMDQHHDKLPWNLVPYKQTYSKEFARKYKHELGEDPLEVLIENQRKKEAKQQEQKETFFSSLKKKLPFLYKKGS